MEFQWSGGFAASQKQKNIRALHDAFQVARPGSRVLEISSKSMQVNGVALSKYVPSLRKSIPVENVFQAGKVFEHGGPYTDLLTVSPKDAKREERLRTSGRLTGFIFDGKHYPTEPKTAFMIISISSRCSKTHSWPKRFLPTMPLQTSNLAHKGASTVRLRPLPGLYHCIRWDFCRTPSPLRTFCIGWSENKASCI